MTWRGAAGVKAPTAAEHAVVVAERDKLRTDLTAALCRAERAEGALGAYDELRKLIQPLLEPQQRRLGGLR